MDVRAATNEQILIWAQGRTETDAVDALATISLLATEHSGLLFRVAFSVVRDRSDAEDVVQETFLRVLKHRNRLAAVENPRVWLVRIAWNLALDRKRRLRSRPLMEEAEEILSNLASEESSAEMALGAAEACARILRTVDTLPQKERAVLKLSAIEKLGTAEIAAILETTESSVRSRLFRARQQLRERLQAEERKKKP